MGERIIVATTSVAVAIAVTAATAASVSRCQREQAHRQESEHREVYGQETVVLGTGTGTASSGIWSDCFRGDDGGCESRLWSRSCKAVSDGGCEVVAAAPIVARIPHIEGAAPFTPDYRRIIVTREGYAWGTRCYYEQADGGLRMTR